MKVIKHLIIILFLTVLTQVGGLIWILSVFLSNRINKKKRFVFPILYLVFNLLIIPPIAKLFGREQLPVFSKTIKPRNMVYPLFFRNYVTPKLKNLLIDASNNLKNNTIKITYLDANFPFYNGFPLLPHLSHNDGKKVDISFLYLDKKGNLTNKKPSVSGYGIYANSKNNTAQNCKKNGYWQYDFTKYMTFGTLNQLNFDKKRTKLLILELLHHHETEKLFIEPYLKQTLGLNNQNTIRFHGCQAVRHDDHIHLQIK